MTESDDARKDDCIRTMLNFARNSEGVTTWAALREKMRADGWSGDEVKTALIAIDPKVI